MLSKHHLVLLLHLCISSGVWSANIPAGRIVGGTKTAISSFPWQVSLQRNGVHYCGGTIYNQRIVITAAHCLRNVPSVSTLQVRAGSNNWKSGGVLHAVAAYKIHEEFNMDTVENDIAVVRVQTPFVFDATVRSINLATNSPTNGNVAYVSGWGLSAYSMSNIATDLQAVQLKIVSRQMCSSAHFNFGSEIKSSMICAYAVNKDACKGDSGGPLVSGGKLVGVVSWGVECALPNYPGVYADVAVLRDWIVLATQNV